MITDALEMKGLTALYAGDSNPSGHIAVDAIKAGDDVLMLPRDLNTAFTAVVAAVRSGDIPEARIDGSVTRILKAKIALGLMDSRLVNVDHAGVKLKEQELYFQAQETSDLAVTLVRDNKRVLPLSHEQPRKILVVTLTDSARSRLGRLSIRK